MKNKTSHLLLLSVILAFFSTTSEALEKSKKKQKIKGQRKIDKQAFQNTTSDDIEFKVFSEQHGDMVDRYQTTKDQNRLSLVYHFNPSLSGANLTSFRDIATFELNYAYRLTNYWLEFQVEKTQSTYKRVSDLSNQHTHNLTEDFITFGLGLSNRFRLFQNYFSAPHVYEYVGANLTYSFVKRHDGRDYAGAGLKSDFGVNYRINKEMHLGMRASYHLIPLKSTDTGVDQETLMYFQVKSETWSWVTLGFEVGLDF